MQQYFNHLIEYYEAFEIFVESARHFGEYKTHFGILDKAEDDYCFFKTISHPQTCPQITRAAQRSMVSLHNRIFEPIKKDPVRILDAGFGCGGTMKLLSESFNTSEIHGVNVNKKQFEIAKFHLRNIDNIQLHLINFFDFEPNIKFNLIYFIESAFHMKPKDHLVSKIDSLLNTGGQVIIVDIIYSEAFANRMGKKKKPNSGIFDYIGLDEWTELFSGVNIVLSEFDDVSVLVSNYLQVKTSPEEFENGLFYSKFKENSKKELYKERLMELYNGYSKLGRLLRRGYLKYGILRFEKK